MIVGLAVLVSGSIMLSGCSRSIESLEKEYGIKIQGVSRLAGGNMLIFRYRVLDPKKAIELTDQKNEPFLIDQASNTKLQATLDTKIRELRLAARAKRNMIVPTDEHFIAFGNQQGVVKAGSKVTVKVGDFKACGLIVQ